VYLLLDSLQVAPCSSHIRLAKNHSVQMSTQCGWSAIQISLSLLNNTALKSRFGGADCHLCTWLGLTLSWYCAAMYDDRSVRSHVRRARDLISTASIHSSLSTALASEYEAKQADATGETPLLIPLQFLPNS
jgi:hypothetical protein